MKPTLLRDWMGHKVKGWLMSEKLDGWRLMWNGVDYITRQGNVLQAPDSWYDGMPDCWLDGELFAGLGQFNTIQGRIANDWSGLSFQVFDVPCKDSFLVRLGHLEALKLPEHCGKVKFGTIRDDAHFCNAGIDVCAAGGEGVVARNPHATYTPGRTNDVLRWVPQDPSINRVSVVR